MKMTTETRDKLRAAARRRGNCRKCGSSNTVLRWGRADRDDEFPDVKYRECSACGCTQALKTRGER